MMRSELARALERSWYEQSSPNWLLRPLAALYGAAVRGRRWAFQRGWLDSQSIGVPVIVVGNITAGGTGKTPLVEWVARRLMQQGRHPGIVSRGYGSSAGRGPRQVHPDDDAAQVGDEPLLLARRIGLPVCVGIDRVAAAKALVIAGADCVIADDGLQHYRLARHLEIAVLDARRLTGNGWPLPAGPLREPLARLDSVDLVLVNGDLQPDRWLGFELVPDELTHLGDGRTRPLTDLAGRRAWAVAGIGNPDRFYASLRRAGIDCVPVPVADHGQVDLAAILAREDLPVLMTEKDAVKYPASTALDAWYLPVNASLSADAEQNLDRLLRGLWPAPDAAA